MCKSLLKYESPSVMLSAMNIKDALLEELHRCTANAAKRTALVGLDGFVDIIVTPVDSRVGPGDQFTPIETITAFAERIHSAAGKSTNIELFRRMEKLGGNGPILAHAIHSAGVKTRYLGALGRPALHPVFERFARETEAISVADPGITNALEFDDGKLMLGLLAPLDDITYDNLVSAAGEGVFFDMFSRADLIALVNWTMIPAMTSILQGLVERVFPNLGPRDHRAFFFDLADPAKRSDGDLITLLHLLREFRAHGSVTLGLNLKEAQQVARVLGLREPDDSRDSLLSSASLIRETLQIDTAVVHPTDCAVCAVKGDAFYAPGFYCPKPKITTGAGDHFNAGFSVGRLIGLSPQSALLLGTAFSGYYVQSADSPGLGPVQAFIRNNEPRRKNQA